jgi:hypothetical protein
LVVQLPIEKPRVRQVFPEGSGELGIFIGLCLVLSEALMDCPKPVRLPHERPNGRLSLLRLQTPYGCREANVANLNTGARWIGFSVGVVEVAQEQIREEPIKGFAAFFHRLLNEGLRFLEIPNG